MLNIKTGRPKKEYKNDTFNMKIDSKIKQNFKLKCIENNTSMSDVLEKFILQYITK